MGITRKAIDWLKYKAASGMDASVEWYRRNGFYRLASMLDGRAGYTGRFINEAIAMQNSVMFGAAKIVGEDVGSTPLFLCRRSADGRSREKDRKNSLYRVLHDAANDMMTAVDFRTTLTMNAVITGAGFAEIIRRSGGDKGIIEMWPWEPTSVHVDQDKSGNYVYLRKDGNSPEKTYYRRDGRVFHLKGISWDGLIGYSIVRQGSKAIDLGLSAEEYAGRFFANDATPGVVLKYPQRMNKEEIDNAKAAWIKAQGGMQRHHEPAVAHSGMDVQKISFSPEESQLLGLRTFFIHEVCRYTRMAPHKLAELSHATFTNVENQEISHVTNCIRPWYVRWEQAISLYCLLPEERDSLYGEHAAEGLLRGDFMSQTVAFSRMLEKGVYSINDVREKLNENPIENGDGHYIQLNMQSVRDADLGLNLQPQGAGLQPDTVPPPQKSAMWDVQRAAFVQ